MGMVSRQAVVDKAAGWVGMYERTGRNDIWFSDDWGITGYAWCFAFVQSCFYYAGAPLPLVSMYCPTGIQYARDNGQAIEVGQGSPLPGDIVFFSWDMSEWPRNRAGTGDHVGVVESYGGGDDVQTIEGNIGSPQGVHRKSRSISGTVVCFWRPPVFTDDETLGPAGTPTPKPNEELFTVGQFEQIMGYLQAQEAARNQQHSDVAGAFAELREGRTIQADQIMGYLQAQENTRNTQHSDVAGAFRTVTGQIEAVQSGVNDAYSNLSLALANLVERVSAGGGGGGGEPAPPVLDVEESLKQATPAQLLAALAQRVHSDA